MKQWGKIPLYQGVDIAQISSIIKQIKNEKKQCWLSIGCTDNSYGDFFTVKKWEEFKNQKKSNNVRILNVMVCYE